MEKFRRNILQRKHHNFTDLLACDSSGDGTFAINRDDNLLFRHILEGTYRRALRPMNFNRRSAPARAYAHAQHVVSRIIHFIIENNNEVWFGLLMLLGFVAVGSVRTECAEA